MNDKLDLKSIAVFCATGFFLDRDTYFIDKPYEYPANSSFNNSYNAFRDFNWHYDPKPVTLDKATDDFAELFESIINEQLKNSRVILPLSGGLDSRTQAAALLRTGNNVSSYSYRYRNGHDETSYSKQIAKKCRFPFQEMVVDRGYLWNHVEQLARLNLCYSEFTHPRQMAFIDRYQSLGDVFSLGHWGDVLFDGMNANDSSDHNQQVQLILKKIIKKGGYLLAEKLWRCWEIEGNFKEYLYERVSNLLNRIDIKNNANARIRAFKSKYWATRWTASNFAVFEHARPITVPYFDTRMCEFICGIPENLLDARQIQIHYIRKYAPELAKIPWQAHRPFNLNNYMLNRVPWNLPYRVIGKAKRISMQITGQKYIQRNWELQFQGKENEDKLHEYLIENKSLHSFIPPEVTSFYFNAFKSTYNIEYAHPVSTLLTLSLFNKVHSK